LANPRHGWGIRGDSFRCLEALGRLGADTWFQLGDLDLATHLYRTERLQQGATLSTVTCPPWAAIISCTIYSPNPVPPGFVVYNGSKMAASWAGGS